MKKRLLVHDFNEGYTELKWVKDFPSEKGWYLYANGKDIRPYLIVMDESNLWPKSDVNYWLGPLPVPELPEGDK